MHALSVGKGFGAKGKQHYKHTASETQSPNKWSHQMQRKIQIQIFPKQLRLGKKYQPDHHLALHCNELLYVTTESVNLDLEIRPTILCHLLAYAWQCGSASKWALKHGAGEAAADKSQGSHSDRDVMC